MASHEGNGNSIKLGEVSPRFMTALMEEIPGPLAKRCALYPYLHFPDPGQKIVVVQMVKGERDGTILHISAQYYDRCYKQRDDMKAFTKPEAEQYFQEMLEEVSQSHSIRSQPRAMVSAMA
jgi:hypothetical protein